MKLSCEQCRELLALGVEHDDLPADAASHLESCADCTRFHADEEANEHAMLRAIVTELRAMPVVSAPADLRERIRAQIAREVADAAPNTAPNAARRSRFSMARPLVPRWATLALPSFALAACLMLLLSREPGTQQLLGARQNQTESSVATSNSAPSSGAQNRITPAAGATKNIRTTDGKNARPTNKTAQSSTRPAPNTTSDTNNDASASALKNTRNARPEAASPEAASPEATSPEVALPEAPLSERNVDSSRAEFAPPRVSVPLRNTVPHSGSAPKMPASVGSSKPAARLFARLETAPASRDAANTDSHSSKTSSKTKGSSTAVKAPSQSPTAQTAAPQTAAPQNRVPSPIVAPSTASKSANASPSSQTMQAGRSRQIENAATSESVSQSTADTMIAPGVNDATESEANAGTNVQAAPQPSNRGATSSGAMKSGEASRRSDEESAPVSPDSFAAKSTTAKSATAKSASSSADSTVIRRAAPSPTSSSSASVSQSASSTRSNRNTQLTLTLPKTSARLRVQIRWPLGATQTVWSGRGTRGQKLRLEVTIPQNFSHVARNKKARLQVSVQEAAPLLRPSRIAWKTIAREEIAIP